MDSLSIPRVEDFNGIAIDYLENFNYKSIIDQSPVLDDEIINKLKSLLVFGGEGLFQAVSVKLRSWGVIGVGSDGQPHIVKDYVDFMEQTVNSLLNIDETPLRLLQDMHKDSGASAVETEFIRLLHVYHFQTDRGLPAVLEKRQGINESIEEIVAKMFEQPDMQQLLATVRNLENNPKLAEEVLRMLQQRLKAERAGQEERARGYERFRKLEAVAEELELILEKSKKKAA